MKSQSEGQGQDWIMVLRASDTPPSTVTGRWYDFGCFLTPGPECPTRMVGSGASPCAGDAWALCLSGGVAGGRDRTAGIRGAGQVCHHQCWVEYHREPWAQQDKPATGCWGGQTLQPQSQSQLCLENPASTGSACSWAPGFSLLHFGFPGRTLLHPSVVLGEGGLGHFPLGSLGRMARGRKDLALFLLPGGAETSLGSPTRGLQCHTGFLGRCLAGRMRGSLPEGCRPPAG